ncbi:hypothetical protein SLA2020_350740 [Shorea laevis]
MPLFGLDLSAMPKERKLSELEMMEPRRWWQREVTLHWQAQCIYIALTFCRMTLLLGPPGCGKTSLLKALSGNLDQSLKLTGEISYNGYKLEEFIPQKTSAYISQNDVHIPDMTVREILDFSARCQGVGSRAEVMMEIGKREKEAGIVPDPDIDTYMKAISVEGLKTTLQTDYILKILGLDICADTLIDYRGDDYATVLVSLLQPAPETFDLFDDLILISGGKIVYHGPRDHVLEYFEDCGFRCPERKGVADFVQEVISRKDQAQYWHQAEVPYSYVSVDMFSRKFKESPYGKKLDEELSEPYDKSQSHQNALSFSPYSLSKWELFRACASRELLLMKRNSFIYIFKTTQLIIIACITMTVLSPVVLLFAMHLSSISMFRFLASVFQTNNASMTAASFALLFLLLFGGFVINKASMPVWLKWAFWVSPMTYGEIGLSVNEFLAPRWQKMLSTNTTIGRETLENRGLNFNGYLYWISLGALFGFAIVFNIGYILALSFLKSPGSSRAIISHEKLSKIQGSEDSHHGAHVDKKSRNSPPQTNMEPNKGRMVLPFTPLTVVFQEVQYYVDTPLEMRERGFANKKLQLLSDITGALRPGVLTALMGVSGAGKTTLLDVLAGRKTGGYIEGQTKIGGYPKVQETFARISGYCEQTDIHSPQITVEESVIFSAWLRLSPEIDSKTKAEFVDEVLETIELDEIKDALVGIPGVSGLSTEQRKRLTIAVELVANPSVIFMDEPTTGLDARAAAIVMRAVKNVADTGRTIVCTVHQPSIDILNHLMS